MKLIEGIGMAALLCILAATGVGGGGLRVGYRGWGPLLLGICVSFGLGSAQSAFAKAPERGESLPAAGTEPAKRAFTIEVYTRPGCPHCVQAKTYLSGLTERHPGLSIVEHDVIRDPQALEKLRELSERRSIRAPGVPTLVIGDVVLVGFDPDVTPKRLESALSQAAAPPTRSEPPKDRAPPTREAEPPTREAEPPAREAEPPKARTHPKPPTPAPPREPQPPLDEPPPFGGPPRGVSPHPTDSDTETEPTSRTPPWDDDGSRGASCAPESTACDELTAPVVELPVIGAVRVEELGLPLFTVVIGLIDGFNPCATWVLLFLLAMLVNLKSRRRMALIAGTFVVVSGVVYFAFMAAWLTFFAVIGVSQVVRVVLALLALAIGGMNVKDFFAFGKGLSLSIPESAKPGLYARVRAILRAENLPAAMLGIIALAFLVNLVELLCTAGLPALYTAILSARGLGAAGYYGYLGLYIVAYMFDDALLVTLGVITLSKQKLQERAGRWLKLLSGSVMLLLGILLLVRPGWVGF